MRTLLHRDPLYPTQTNHPCSAIEEYWSQYSPCYWVLLPQVSVHSTSEEQMTQTMMNEVC